MAQVSDCSVSLYSIPTNESLDDATQSFDTLELVVVRVETNSGEKGLGLTYTIGEGGSAIAEFVATTLKPIILDEPAAPRIARNQLRAKTTFVGREGIAEIAISAIDIALWDALGRRTGLPLYELLGAERRRVPTYYTDGGWLQYDNETLVENACTAAETGYTGMKMKVGRSHAEDETRIREVYAALPEHMELMIDANCAYSVAEAKRLAARVTDVDLAWLEEPLRKGDYVGHADLREAVNIPIALGENLYSEHQFAQATAVGAADVLQPDVCRVGGITPWIAVAEAARACDTPVVPHYIEPIHTHLALAFENVPYIERHSTVLDSVLETSVDLQEGAILPPETPGHGITFEGIERYRVEF